jgi:large subunit ribosomal protein L13e
VTGEEGLCMCEQAVSKIKTWLDQPARKKTRRLRRDAKAKKIYPRPVTGLLRPIVRCPTAKYNSKVRSGRGFTLEELKAANINPLQARGLGIAVDYRRKNATSESLQANVQRLELYKSKLIVFPRKSQKPKKGDTSDKEKLDSVNQRPPKFAIVVQQKRDKSRAITKDEKSQSAYLTLRKERAKARRVGLAKKKKEEETAQTTS